MSHVGESVEGANEVFSCPKVSHAMWSGCNLRLSGEILGNIVWDTSLALLEALRICLYDQAFFLS